VHLHVARGDRVDEVDDPHAPLDVRLVTDGGRASDGVGRAACPVPGLETWAIFASSLGGQAVITSTPSSASTKRVSSPARP
jgi:hypothetical protein